jgi:hypothetical protein
MRCGVKVFNLLFCRACGALVAWLASCLFLLVFNLSTLTRCTHIFFFPFFSGFRFLLFSFRYTIIGFLFYVLVYFVLVWFGV